MKFWLGTVPNNTEIFCQIGLMCLWIDTMLGPLGKGIMAVGNIRNYQLISSIIWLSSIPISWFLLVNGMPFKYILSVKFLILICSLVYNVIYLSKHSQMSGVKFLLSNILQPLLILICSYAIGFWLSRMVTVGILLNIAVTSVITISTTLILLFLIGMNRKERDMIINFLKSRKSNSMHA